MPDKIQFSRHGQYSSGERERVLGEKKLDEILCDTVFVCFGLESSEETLRISILLSEPKHGNIYIL